MAALAGLFNPWVESLADAGIVFFVFEAIFLVVIGIPVFVYHLRNGLGPRDALSASLDSVMGFVGSFLAGWA